MIFIPCSGLFRDVPECSGMFRDVPECSWFYRRPIFSHNYHNYSMLRDVPCSGFYRLPKSCAWRIFESSSVFHKSEDLNSIAVVLLFIGESLSLNPKGWMLRQELYNIAKAKSRLMNGNLKVGSCFSIEIWECSMKDMMLKVKKRFCIRMLISKW